MSTMEYQILMKLNQLISSASSPNLFHSPRLQSNEWPFAFAAVAVFLLCLLCCCFMLTIINCVAWSAAIISELCMKLWGICNKVLSNLSSCCSRPALKMIKAPGRGGRLFIPRSQFEADPARSYFVYLRPRVNDDDDHDDDLVFSQDLV